MFRLPVELPGFQLGAFRQLQGRLHQPEQHPFFRRFGEQVPLFAVADGGQDDVVHSGGVADALGAVGEAGFQQLRRFKEVGDVLPGGAAAGLDDDPAVLAGHRVFPHRAGRAADLRSADEGVDGLGGHHRRSDAFGDRNVDMLSHAVPFLGEQGHCGGAGAEQPALVLGLKAAMLQGRAALHPADAHHHSHRVGNDFGAGILAIRAALPEGGYGSERQTGVDRRQGGVADTQVVQVARTTGLNHQVNIGYQLAEDAAAGGRLQVEGDAFFVQVEDEEEQAFFRVGVVVVEGGDAAHCGAGRGFYFQHVGAVVGQQPGAERAGDVRAEIQDFDARQRAVHASIQFQIHNQVNPVCGRRFAGRPATPVVPPARRAGYGIVA